MVIALLFAIVWAASYYAMSYACRRGKELDFNIDAEIERSHYKKHMDHILFARNWLAEHPHEEICIRSYDGLELVGTFVPAENARATLLMFHGWRSTPLVDFSRALPLYHALGISLLIADQRSHGRSQGRYITYGVRERKDVHSWIAWHNGRFGADAPLLITGLSMGATTVLMACGQPMPDNVRGVIADCGFTSPNDIIRKVARDMLPLAPYAVPLLGLQARCFAGFGLKECSTLDALKDFKKPVFLVHGTGDTFVPYEMTQAAHDACSSADKTLLLVEGAGHGMSFIEDQETYVRLLTDFIERCLQSRENEEHL